MTRGRAAVLFARVPRAGTVKTRLVPPLSPVQALALHRALVEDSVALLKTAARTAGARPFLAFSEPWEPPARGAGAALRRAASGVARLPQRGGDLGARLRAALEDLLASGHAAVAILGSDSPTLPPGRLDAAFVALDAGADVALVPAEDGGYCLVAARRVVPGMFRGIAWGGPAVLRDTLAAIEAEGGRASLLPPWHDIDQVSDLRRLAGDPGAARPSTAAAAAGEAPFPAPRTRACLAALARAGALAEVAAPSSRLSRSR